MANRILRRDSTNQLIEVEGLTLTITYRYIRSGQIEEMKIERLDLAMGLAALNFRESIEPIEIVDVDNVYGVTEMKQYIKENNLN